MFDMKLIPILLTLVLMTSCGQSAESLTPPGLDAKRVSTPSPTLTVTPASVPFAVIGYFPDYRELNPAWAEHLTDIIYFSAEPRADGTLDTSRLNEETWQLLQQMKTEHGIRIHLSIGGWERSAAFASITNNLIARHKFINSIVEFALAHHLDGVDFDWEFPKDKTELREWC
jgi:chitinase